MNRASQHQMYVGTTGGSFMATPKRVIIEFPNGLLKETERAAQELSTNRSEFIRAAVKEKLEELDRLKMEQELAAAYEANAQVDRELAAEFGHVVSENL